MKFVISSEDNPLLVIYQLPHGLLVNSLPSVCQYKINVIDQENCRLCKQELQLFHCKKMIKQIIIPNRHVNNNTSQTFGHSFSFCHHSVALSVRRSFCTYSSCTFTLSFLRFQTEGRVIKELLDQFLIQNISSCC